MRIAFVVREDYKEFFGGDVSHAFILKKYLEAAGNAVEILSPPYDVRRFDVCHAFNIVRPFEAYLAAQKCRQEGVSFVLSPIFDDINELGFARRTPGFRLAGTLGIAGIEYAKFFYLKLFRKNPHLSPNLIDSVESIRRELIKFSDGIATWSNWEANYLSRKYGGRRYRTIRAGATHLNSVPHGENVQKKKRMVLCVGLFSDRKNQESLVRCASFFDCEFAFVGTAAPGYRWYYDRCRSIAPRNCAFLGKLTGDEVAALYEKAHVFCLPSTWESAGLAGLEAANYGCNLVLSNIPVLKEYFPGLAYFCEPDSIDSIVRSISDALDAPPDALSAMQFVRRSYNWEDIIKELVSFYRSVV